MIRTEACSLIVSTSEEWHFLIASPFWVKLLMPFRYRNVEIFRRTAGPLGIHYFFNHLLACGKEMVVYYHRMRKNRLIGTLYLPKVLLSNGYIVS